MSWLATFLTNGWLTKSPLSLGRGVVGMGASSSPSPTSFDLNQSAAAALYYAVHEDPSLASPTISPARAVNVSSPIALSSARPPDSPLAVSGAVLAVCVLSPLIMCGNALLLGAVYRFKRLRTPSNYLVAALAASDLGIGLLLPVGLYLELTKYSPRPLVLCLVPYCVAIALGSASLCAMAAIAADRFTSLAQPLRYNNLITHTSIERYIAGFWIYSVIIGFSPFYYLDKPFDAEEAECTFLSINTPIHIFLFSAVYGPCALVLLTCYGYIYVVARYHAKAIYSVELSLRQPQGNGTGGVTTGNDTNNLAGSTATSPAAVTNHSRYGQTLALTDKVLHVEKRLFQLSPSCIARQNERFRCLSQPSIRQHGNSFLDIDTKQKRIMQTRRASIRVAMPQARQHMRRLL
ncbi:hypothetical protein B566_EDAN001650 [Ephemera danica]|nr:hypothetical protein B566_EDAN001650 [Ephemera danica]